MSTAARSSPSPSTNRLEDSSVGYALSYPTAWRVRDQVVTTEFSGGARCQAVEVVDFEPPPWSSIALLLHAFVQVCARPVGDGSSLDDFIRATYPGSFPTRFDLSAVNGHRAYRAAGPGADETIFLQTEAHRIQIVASAVTSPDRRSEIREVLDSVAVR